MVTASIVQRTWPAFVLLALLSARVSSAQPAPAYGTPDELWRAYDPTVLPLEVELVESRTEADCTFDKLFFTGEETPEGKVRVFALQGAPHTNERRPGILHIHGGGQTASAEWVKFWTTRGYVCVSFDFCGPWAARTEFTDWGPLKQGNMQDAGAGYPTTSDPRTASWYHWAIACRRALTLLAAHPKVDPEKLGIFGISVGGTLCWLVAASDVRVKTAVPIYGCGYNADRRRTGVALDPSTALYKQLLSPEAHAPYINCPILLLSATNDFHGAIDNAYEILGAVDAPARQAFTPRQNHHVAADEGSDLERWMRWQLQGGDAFPATAPLEVGIDERGLPFAELRTDAAERVETVNVYYALGSRVPQARFWRRAECANTEQVWRASLPVMDTWDDVVTFANVKYRSGVTLSSSFRHVIPGQLGKAKATLAWCPTLDVGRDGENWIYVNAPTDPSRAWKFVEACDGPRGAAGFRLDRERFVEGAKFAVGSHIVGDPQFAGKEGLLLEFACVGVSAPDGLTVACIEKDWQPSTRTYTADVPADALGDDWSTVRLPLSAFISKEGQQLARWQDVDKIELRGTASKHGPPSFATFRWAEPE